VNSHLRDALALHEASKEKLAAMKARDCAQQALSGELEAQLKHAEEGLREVAARHIEGNASDADLSAARLAYTERQRATAALKVEREGVAAAIKAAEDAVSKTWRAVNLAAAHAAETHVHRLQAQASVLAKDLRALLIDYRAAVRFANAAVSPNELIRCTETGEPYFQRQLRTELFEPASAEEIKVYSAADFAR
jgi:hypothetical protein